MGLRYKDKLAPHNPNAQLSGAARVALPALYYLGLKFLTSTTSVFTVPRDKASCFPSRAQAKLKMRCSRKSVSCLAGLPSIGWRHRLETPSLLRMKSNPNAFPSGAQCSRPEKPLCQKLSEVGHLQMGRAPALFSNLPGLVKHRHTVCRPGRIPSPRRPHSSAQALHRQSAPAKLTYYLDRNQRRDTQLISRPASPGEILCCRRASAVFWIAAIDVHSPEVGPMGNPHHIPPIGGD